MESSKDHQQLLSKELKRTRVLLIIFIIGFLVVYMFNK
uniref:Uncharacterized protein n=1 Tax=Nelumbo nucifera TaxID=4432 RepID=A0A822ZKJ3_NELNU|nr:TPA_asm: hypothetical protein HUJ06_001756 [Nelumbo nucifera]